MLRKILMRNSQKSAWRKLDTGPAAETQILSVLGLRRCEKFTGTGLAHPKIMPPNPDSALNTNITPGTKIVPTGSMCLIGFKVTLPNTQAVLSPK